MGAPVVRFEIMGGNQYASLGRPRNERPRIAVPSRGWNNEALETRRRS